MGMTAPVPQFSHFASVLKERHPKLAYIHVIEPRIDGNLDRTVAAHDFLREIWHPLPYISAGGYVTRENAVEVANLERGLIDFGRMYISNASLRDQTMHSSCLTLSFPCFIA
jgi:NADPH2 dehydrogenase